MYAFNTDYMAKLKDLEDTIASTDARLEVVLAKVERNSPRLTVDDHDARGLPSPNPRQEFQHEGTPLVVLHKDTLARGNSSRKGRHKGHAVSSSSTRGLPSPVLHTRGTLVLHEGTPLAKADTRGTLSPREGRSDTTTVFFHQVQHQGKFKSGIWEFLSRPDTWGHGPVLT
uniref:Uncharacterized protein n=1 Tax=Branchiostoma floridae TaxID=7739 RepID=C3ZW79_BRAFL|eukprot:XP_002587199.1 hypothetical protein BRAFLDRAFT_102085 [Branchiostoma floridae]